MNNTYYEKMYDKHISPLYGLMRKNEEDKILINGNNLPHKYSIVEQRVDITDIECYSVDPPGCEDADDAFSVYYENDKLYLAIHIADPTEYININTDLWKSIENKIVTRYPSNRKPFHMMPDEIMEISSLMVNRYGNIKNAVSVITEIHKETYIPVGNVKLLYTRIKVKNENALTYSEACEHSEDIFAIKTSLKISEALVKKRGNATKGVVLNNISTSIVKYTNNIPTLENVSSTEKSMKQMIAEFAIFANSFIGNYLKVHFNGSGIFRTCNASELLNSSEVINMTGDELLHAIITQGIQADYMSTVSSHDLVGSEEYTHFTSPIRRVSDCVCHYLLKYLYLKQHDTSLNPPFTLEELTKISEKCIDVSKQIKKIQYRDSKYRLIQVMNNMLLQKSKLTITYYITSYKNGFLNIIIDKINNYNTYLSYTLRKKDFVYVNDPKKKYTIEICQVNCPKKFDEGSIPELDQQFTV
jgi:exoribonuclease R